VKAEEQEVTMVIVTVLKREKNKQVSQQIEVEEKDLKKSLMTILQEKGLPVASSCKGEGVCLKCRVRIRDSTDHSDRSDSTDCCINALGLEEKSILSCQYYLTGDCQVTASYW
jgi:ferredoxin, 2Fe-2S